MNRKKNESSRHFCTQYCRFYFIFSNLAIEITEPWAPQRDRTAHGALWASLGLLGVPPLPPPRSAGEYGDGSEFQ